MDRSRVAVGSEAQWHRFCSALGRPDLATDPTFATNATRVENRRALRAELEPLFAARPSEAWLATFATAEVPSGPINDLAQAFEGPPEAVVTVAHPTAGTLRLPGMPYRFAATPATVRRPPPLLDEHGDEIRAWLDSEPSGP